MRGAAEGTRIAAAALLLAVALAAARSEAATPVFGAAAPVNGRAATDAGSDGSPRVATDGRGTWVTVWAATDDEGHDSDVLAAHSSDLGISWTAPVALNADAAEDDAFDFAPALATDGAGRWIAVWTATNGADTDLFTARSVDDGRTWSAPGPLHGDAATDAGNDDRAQIATDGAGTWIVVWDANGRFGSDRDVLVVRSTDGGVTWSAPAALASNATTDRGSDQRPQLATDGAGRWIAVWASSDTLGGTTGIDLDVFVARSEDGGLTWTAPRALASTAGTDQAVDDRPQLATDGQGTWVAAWVSDDTLGDTIGSDLDVLVARSTDGGATWSAPQALNGNAATDAGEDGAPTLVTDRQGTWVAVWESNDTLGDTVGSDHDLLMAHSLDGGAHWSAPHALDPDAATDTRRDVAPQLATDGAGVWNAVWSGSGGSFGADTDVLRAGGRERCGDGVVDPGEQCDDGNTQGGDACPPSCEFPPPATPLPSATPGAPSPGGDATATPADSGGTPSPGSGGTPGSAATGTGTPAPATTATPEGGESPEATADPSPTPTPSPAGPTPTGDPPATASALASPTPSAGPGATAPAPTPTPSAGSGFAGGLASRAAAKAAVACQRAVLKTGAQLVGKRLRALGGCARGIQRCIQTKPDDPACLAKIGLRCQSGLVALARVEAKAEASLGQRCAGLAIADLLRPAGLGYAATACDGSGLGDVVACVVGEHACRAGALVEALHPRAKELMRLPGASAATLDTVACLPDHGGDGAALGDPAGAGKAVDLCTSTIVASGSTFVRKRLARLAQCADALFACVQLKPDDGACLAKARARCDQGVAAGAADERAVTKKTAARCGDAVIAYATLRAAPAANLDALAHACAEVGVPELERLADYQQCLVRLETCRVEDVLRVQAPRAAELLAVIGRAAGSGYCPE